MMAVFVLIDILLVGSAGESWFQLTWILATCPERETRLSCVGRFHLGGLPASSSCPTESLFVEVLTLLAVCSGFKMI